MARAGIFIDYTLPNPSLLLRTRKDWPTLLTADPDYVGIWMADNPDNTLNAGKIETFANFAGAGATLTQGSAAQRVPLTTDADLHRSVGVWDGVASHLYELSGGVFEADEPYTMGVVFKAADTSLLSYLIGSNAGTNERAQLAWRETQGIDFGWLYHGDTLVPAQPPGVIGQWHRLVGVLTAGAVPKASLDGYPFEAGAVSAHVPVVPNTDFQLGDAFLKFEGRIDLAFLYQADLTDGSHTTLWANLQDFLTQRGV